MKMQMRSKFVALSAVILAACGGGGGATDSGSLRLALTDAPACGYDQVNVTIQKVRVHTSSAATDSDAGWSEVLLSPAKRVDLLTLSNGVLAELGQTALPTGHYTQLRLVLAANDGANPMANAVTPTGGTETALATPSASQTGLKMNVNIDVAANKVADFVLDFDACKSVVKLGHSGQYNLKPVVSVIPRLADATQQVVGYVAPALAASANVSLQLNGVTVKSTPPTKDGKFILYPVPVGTYDLVVNAQGRVTATITGVPVVATGISYVNTSTSAIDPPASTMRIASGSVSTAGVNPIDATVTVIKKYTAGPNVTVASAPVDGSTGVFSYSIPSQAPVKTTYSANATALNFVADAATPTGKYTLSASSGAATKTQDIDVTTLDSTGTSVSF